MYKFLFLVGSAINHFEEGKLSKFSTEERFQQTVETIQSILWHIPDAYILIYELSETELDPKHKEYFERVSDAYIECKDDYVVKGLYENAHIDPNRFTYIKSMLECRGIELALHHIGREQLFTDATRIFKISGRYSLNDDFNINDYKSNFLTHKYVMKTYEYEPRFEQMDNLYATLYGCKGCVVTGLWSFDRYLFLDVMYVLHRSFEYMEKAIQITAGIDIEHSFYHFLDPKKIIDIPVLGLNLIKGMDGETYTL